jgi:UDP-N-acetylmuramoyl-L-alanyl-D-glutamate--2,6-diaminopimelate ligase
MQADMLSINKQFPETFDQSIKPLLAHFSIDAPDIMISGIVLDSREVAIHKAFVAIDGHALDGRDFIPQAISLGAKVILAECELQHDHGLVEMREQSIIVFFYHLAEKLSELAGYFYQEPAKSMSVIAVTGTNGKTSTVQLSTQLAVLLGERAASIGTMGAGMFTNSADNLQETPNTTPDAISMQMLLANFMADGAFQVALEASSHALIQNRIKAVKTDVAIFTNLTRDHLDYHGSMSEYAAAKRLLLSQPELAYAILNAADPEYKNWLSEVPKSVKVVLFAQDIEPEDLPGQYQYCLATNVRYTSEGIELSLQSSWGNCELHLTLFGEFNVANVLGAICSQLCLGKNLQTISYIAQQLQPVPGRMELYTRLGHASIVVDYAHTPDALEKALLASKQHCKGKIWCVFGCGGDRDAGKRGLMGEVAEKLANHIILTDDNVRSENADDIVADILSGCINPELVLIEHDRKKAIKAASTAASKDDIILLAGKGHENYQIIGNHRLPYDERQFVSLFQKGKTS